MIVRTFDGLQALTTPQPTWGSSGEVLSLYNSYTYFEIFRTQPNVRICVEFLARNIADVPPQVFRRVSDTDRVRLVDHDLAHWLSHPNPGTTRYRLFEDLMIDLGIYDRAYWLKVRYVGADRRDAIGLVSLPPEEVTVEGGLLPTDFVWTTNGRDKRFAPSEIVHFAGYRRGISPLETLRRLLAEEMAAGEHREAYWRNAGRHETVIEQSKEAPNYTPKQLTDFRQELREFSGRGSKVGEMMMLPKGMTTKSASFSAKDSEYIQGGKLRREVVAAEYQIPQPFVGILDHATFSNIREQHKNLYQDCLGPWFEQLRQEIHRQLLVECEDQRDVYVEFNVDKKLAGTPEERASSMQISIGRPWRTVNEGRALDNLPSLDDPEFDTIAPQQGGPSDATAHPDRTPPVGRSDDEEARTVAPILQAHRARLQVRLDKFATEERALAFVADLDRWNRELAADMTPLVGVEVAARLAAQANAETLNRLETEAQHV